jgi:polar amino acid transport system permease protein
MGYGLTLRRIILPQAMRAILPGLINDTISMLKLTSIASVIFVNELTFRAQQIVPQNFKFFQVYVATGAIYLALTSAITALQSVLERRFDRRVAAPSSCHILLGFQGRPDAVVHHHRARRIVLHGASAPMVRPIRIGCAACSARPTKHGVGSRCGRSETCRNLWRAGVLCGVIASVTQGRRGGDSPGLEKLRQGTPRMINHLEAMDWGEITRSANSRARRTTAVRTPMRDRARAEARIGMYFSILRPVRPSDGAQNITEAPCGYMACHEERGRPSPYSRQ